jgi:hypothetical protein
MSEANTDTRIAELEAALAPFARYWEGRRQFYIQKRNDVARWIDRMPDHWPVNEEAGKQLTVGDFRRALAALE